MKRRMMILVLAYVMVVPGTAFAASKADEQAEVRHAARKDDR